MMNSGKRSGEASSASCGKKRKLEEVVTLSQLCLNKQWNEAMARAISHPEEALVTAPDSSPSPLALACRFGAPAECVQAILESSPEAVRQVLHCRGTPLHEAIVFKSAPGEPVRPNVQVMEVLIQADAKLPGKSACLIQDADGCTPLHLLIKWKFPSFLGQEDGDADWFHLLQLVIQSSPEAVGLPDRGDYQEPPLVMALKANVYVAGQSDDRGVMFQRVERRIRQTVACMLEYYPQAVIQTLVGALGQYSALHSAAFHGRCWDTIQLLLNAEQQQGGGPSSRAALVANTHGECPLHFATMRGEPAPSIALLANAAPRAILKRDALGFTPFHWLWTRFISTLQAIENDRGETTITVRPITSMPTDKYLDFALLLHHGNSYADLNMIRKLDPSVDFFRMRHIPPELGSDDDVQEWVDRTVQVLTSTRQGQMEQLDHEHSTIWTRREAVTSLFWTKVVSLIRAVAASTTNATADDNGANFYLVHQALACPSCPSPIVRLICSVFSDELLMIDKTTGRLPLHNAACRPWHSWDWPLADAEEEQGAPASSKFLRGESIAVLQHALEVSPPQAARVADHQGRLVLHHVIDSFVHACSNSGRSYMVDAHEPHVKSMLQVLRQLVQSYTSSLERRDGKTKLYPFLQATAVATKHRPPPSSTNGLTVPFADEMPLSIVYQLLRENPSLVGSNKT